MPTERPTPMRRRDPAPRAPRARCWPRLLALPATAVAACALAVPASAGATVLHDQYNGFDPGAPLTAATPTGSSLASYAYARDDFRVPSRQAWTIRQVDVRGTFIDGEPAKGRQFVVTVSEDRNGKPGNFLGQAVASADLGSTSKDIVLRNLDIRRAGATLALRTGRYWLNVGATCAFPCVPPTPWLWYDRRTMSHQPATWEYGFLAPVGAAVPAPCHRGPGYRATECHMDKAHPDQVFRLRGSVSTL